MKTACVYHSVDLDGWMSAAIVEHWFIKKYPHYLINNFRSGKPASYSSELIEKLEENSELMELEFIGYNYGQSIPDLSGYDKVIMCDISLPPDIMNNLLDRLLKDFIWLDHHVSAISNPEIHENWIEGLRTSTYAACELTWRYFFPNEDEPEIVRLLGRYDCFGHKGTDEEQKVLEFQYGARQCITNYEEAYYELVKEIKLPSKHSILDILNNGKSIYQYLCVDARQSYKNGFEVYLLENKDESIVKEQVKKFICINKERFNPINFGIDYHSDGYDGCACFYFDGNHYNFSLHNDNGLVDCSVIAKQYGGGGHRGASGFRLTPDQFRALTGK